MSVDTQKALEAADVALKEAVAARETAEGHLADLVRTVGEKEAALESLRRETDAAHAADRGGALEKLRARRRDLRLDIEELRAEMGDEGAPVGLRRVIEKARVEEYRAGIALAQAKRTILASQAADVGRHLLDALAAVGPFVEKLEHLDRGDRAEVGMVRSFSQRIKDSTGESENTPVGSDVAHRAGLDRAFLTGIKSLLADVARLQSLNLRPE